MGMEILMPKDQVSQKTAQAFMEMLNTVRRALANFAECMPPQITPGSLFLLEAVAKEAEETSNEKQGIRVSLLSERVGMSKPATSRLLKDLEGKGMVCRQLVKEDRRLVYISLTREGKMALARAQENIAAFSQGITERMGVVDTERFIELMGRFADALMQMKVKESQKNCEI